jgi:hypothetical protein
LTVGYRSTPGSGYAISKTNTIRLSLDVSYYLIGHELTHLLQGKASEAFGGRKIPDGERACDVFTIARCQALCDAIPCYLHIEKRVDIWTWWELRAKRIVADYLEQKAVDAFDCFF